ncbi:nitrate reductase molybdenum cofactor assembly chaperone [Alkalilimnicola ehrlichii]|uniref:Nitrate reductase molybdenum cofactor assembly chaperone n=1 Tax=Alkalilimnicola ehrlichii TaxID=351052 RepID=A0A3E0WZW0_9GAMM|nr:nitrate reductase molybdenum cofactor assembly chaperone [Alkalilimnicola ehrlichii]RFA28996.1 nitrate reductase molybdenum cofactor assembly chaperone [Alkalilimnicola ehrlichii]RFA38631.1 nitrate reductase molybdenum cofactor assembly chaperone [Alkalilimnicola ehrlichii]
MLTFKVLSLLLRYPTAEIHEALPEMRSVLERERLLPEAAQHEVRSFIEELMALDLIRAQERYVELFDRGRKLSLHIFEHTHGESRERGPAMVQLMTHYQDCGFELDARELPDYLPLVLEFLAERSVMEAREMLGEAIPVVTLVAARLRERDSRYAVLLEALEAFVGISAEERAELHRQVAEEGPDEAIVNMDKIWEEEAVSFTQESALASSSKGGGADVQPVQWDVGMRRKVPAQGSNT